MLKITIEGPAASGKSAVAQAIGKFLQSNGFLVDVDDPDAPRSIADLANALTAAARKGEVSIKTIRTPKES